MTRKKTPGPNDRPNKAKKGEATAQPKAAGRPRPSKVTKPQSRTRARRRRRHQRSSRRHCRRRSKRSDRWAVNNLYRARGQAVQSARHHQDVYMALSYTVRDYLIDRWRQTTEAQFAANPKFVYYLSAEYLPGKQLAQNILYTGTEQSTRESLAARNLDLDRYYDIDVEPGLGNGGLGRLAACFLDSLATLDIPAVGYGIRYEFGIFRQTFEDGWQVEKPDNWLLSGNPWEFIQSDDMVKVGFWGHTEDYFAENGSTRTRWVPSREVYGEPCTTLVPGYQTKTVNILVRIVRSAGARRSLTSSCSTLATTRAPWTRKSSPRRSRRCCIPTTPIPMAGNCGSSSSTSSWPVRCTTFCAGSG